MQPVYIAGIVGAVAIGGYVLLHNHQTAAAQQAANADTSTVMTGLALGAGGGFNSSGGFQPAGANVAQGSVNTVGSSPASAMPSSEFFAQNLKLMQVEADQHKSDSLMGLVQDSYRQLFASLPVNRTTGGSVSSDINETISGFGANDILIKGHLDKTLPGTIADPIPIVVPQANISTTYNGQYAPDNRYYDHTYYNSTTQTTNTTNIRNDGTGISGGGSDASSWISTVGTIAMLLL